MQETPWVVGEEWREGVISAFQAVDTRSVASLSQESFREELRSTQKPSMCLELC